VPLTGATHSEPARLRVESVSKSFGATRALVDVTFEAREGEIHALLGENGAGKSTLVRVMGGVLAPDSGRMLIDGESRALSSPTIAFNEGIAVVHQELAVMDNMTVADNLVAGAAPLHGRALRVLGFIDRDRQIASARETLAFLGIDVPLEERVGNLSLALKQRIEIARATSRGSRVLILDEPTSALPPSERTSLYEVMRVVQERGVAIVFITHNVREALKVSDTVTVLRDGRVVSRQTARGASIPSVITDMTGTAPPAPAQSADAEASGMPRGSFTGRRAAARTVASHHSKPRLQLLNLSCPPRVDRVSLELARGEIVGLAGLVGSGRTELLECVFGARRRVHGDIFLDGKPCEIQSVADAIAAGIGLVPEDRRRDALFLNESVAHNVAAAARNARRRTRAPWAEDAEPADDLDATVQHLVSELRIKTPSVKAPVRALSGGNQQKVILARWMMLRPRVLLADDPGRGVSVGAKQEVHRLLREVAARGTAILLASSEFDELSELCDRIVLIDRGRSVNDIPVSGLTGEQILREVLTAADEAAGRETEVAR